MPHAEEEKELVERASRADPTAVEQLLQEHLPRLHAFVRLRMGVLLRSREESSDLVQSICRVILTRQGEFRDANAEWGWTSIAWTSAGTRDGTESRGARGRGGRDRRDVRIIGCDAAPAPVRACHRGSCRGST